MKQGEQVNVPMCNRHSGQSTEVIGPYWPQHITIRCDGCGRHFPAIRMGVRGDQWIESPECDAHQGV